MFLIASVHPLYLILLVQHTSSEYKDFSASQHQVHDNHVLLFASTLDEHFDAEKSLTHSLKLALMLFENLDNLLLLGDIFLFLH